MTATQMEQKNNKGNSLHVFPAGNDNYMVESSQGKIFYKVFLNGGRTCTCADHVNSVQKDPGFLCKHILAAIGHVTGTGKKPSLDERFIIQIKRKETVKEFVLYAGLLDLAHQKGIKRMLVEAIQYPTKDNKMEAICKAIVESKDGEIFTELADANPLNVNYMVAEHILRVAATRAKARALRDFTNIGMTCLEELGDIEDVIDDKQKGKTRKDNNQQKAEGTVDGKNDQAQKAAQASERQKEAAHNAGVHDRDSSKETPPANHQPQPPHEAHQENKEKNVKAKISEAQMKAIERLKDIRCITNDQLHEMFQKQFGIPFTDITGDEAKVFIRSLQQAA